MWVKAAPLFQWKLITPGSKVFGVVRKVLRREEGACSTFLAPRGVWRIINGVNCYKSGETKKVGKIVCILKV